jgi:hypothetical protein
MLRRVSEKENQNLQDGADLKKAEKPHRQNKKKSGKRRPASPK